LNAHHELIDVLIIGSGIAGLSVALELAGERDVVVLAKEPRPGGSTALAQGGIAAAIGPGDDAVAHASDTVAAAAGLGDREVAVEVTAEAARAVERLANLGVNFDVGALAKEGGHSAARVVHARGDATGAEVSQALWRAAEQRRIPLMMGCFLADLLVAPDGERVVGALIWDSKTGVLRTLRAKNTVLATGGYGQLWASTTSSAAGTGDGVAAALRAGAQVADLEFVQFHPTGMLLGHDPRPLASEALRGAGARLRDANGEYLNRVTSNGVGDLAPRDVVSRGMARRMAELGADHCYLDATALGKEQLQARFPTFVGACRASGLDPSLQWVPVSPTAHYTMGGALTDADGRTTIEGLMAVGEVASSGLHGANRLASNSLLEGAVIGRRAGAALVEEDGPVAPRSSVPIKEILAFQERHRAGGEPLDRRCLRAAMEAGAGVMRDEEMLAALESRLRSSSLTSPDPAYRPEVAEVANMRLVAQGVAALALRRQESRGAHWRSDYPEPRRQWLRRQVLQLLPGNELAVGDLPVEAVGVAQALGASPAYAAQAATPAQAR